MDHTRYLIDLIKAYGQDQGASFAAIAMQYAEALAREGDSTNARAIMKCVDRVKPLTAPLLQASETDDSVWVKPTGISYCQVCGIDFMEDDIVYYAPTDNNIVCPDCSHVHKNRQVRICRSL